MNRIPVPGGVYTGSIRTYISSLAEDETENTILRIATMYFLIYEYSAFDEMNYLKITDRADSEVREEFREYEYFRSEAEKVLKGIIPQEKMLLPL